MLERRNLVKLLLAGAAPFAISSKAAATGQSIKTKDPTPIPDGQMTDPLHRPSSGIIKVAFLIAADAEIVDFGGPWGVFEYVYVDSPSINPFKLYTVAETSEPVTISGGMIVKPNYSIADVPQPDIIVVPAMDIDEVGPKVLAWLRNAHDKTQVTMSVCNGSYVLAKAGLLDGRTATAHHGGYGMLRAMFPLVNVIRGKRWLEDGRIATSGGLTSGQDLALRIVERYFGRATAFKTARQLEYQGTGWMYPNSNAEFSQRPVSTAEDPHCPVCEARIAQKTEFIFTYKSKTHMFCSIECRTDFIKTPERFLVSGGGIG